MAAMVVDPAVAPVGDESLESALSDAMLDSQAAQDMTAGRFDDAAVMSDKFKDKSGGSTMAAKVAKYLFSARSHVQHIFADVETTEVVCCVAFVCCVPLNVKVHDSLSVICVGFNRS